MPPLTADPVAVPPPELTASPAPGPAPAPSAEAVTAKGPRRRLPTSPPAPTPAPKAAQDPCDPPFSIDATGRKHFKIQCIQP